MESRGQLGPLFLCFPGPGSMVGPEPLNQVSLTYQGGRSRFLLLARGTLEVQWWPVLSRRGSCFSDQVLQHLGAFSVSLSICLDQCVTPPDRGTGTGSSPARGSPGSGQAASQTEQSRPGPDGEKPIGHIDRSRASVSALHSTGRGRQARVPGDWARSHRPCTPPHRALRDRGRPVRKRGRRDPGQNEKPGGASAARRSCRGGLRH